MARRLFPVLRGALETKGLAARTRSTSTRYSVAGIPYQVAWNVDRAVTEGFQGNPWVFRAVEVIAYSGLTRQIIIREGDPNTGKPVPISRDPSRLLYRLNRRANPWETAEMFRYRLVAQFLLSSRGVFIEVTRSRAGTIAMLTLVDPDLVDIIPSPRNPIASFRVRTTGDTGGRYDVLPPFDSEAGPEQTNSILWVRSPHPTILTEGMSPMQAAGLSVDLDRYARLYNRDYMQSSGRPGGILSVKGIVEADTIQTLEARFNTDTRPGKVTAISAEAMDYKDLSTAPRDMQWGESMRLTRGEVSIIFGVPESMMGDASGKTFDNADAEYSIYMEHRFAPFVGMLDSQLDTLNGGYNDDRWLRHDLSDVWVLARHRRSEEDRAVADFNAGLISLDDVREIKGYSRLNTPASRVLWVPAGRLAVGDGLPGHEDDAELAGQAPQGGVAAPPDPGIEAELGAAQGGGVTSSDVAASRLRVVGGVGGYGGATGLEERSAIAAGALDTEAGQLELEGKQSRARTPSAAPSWR